MVPTKARNGASESFVTSPAHTRSQSAARTVGSSKGCPACWAAWVRSAQNEAPRWSRCVSRAVWSESGSKPSTGDSSSPAWSRKARRMRPSLEPMAPAPTHTTSPDVQSASRSDRLVLGQAHPEDVAVERRCDEGCALELRDHVDERVGAPPSLADAVPAREERARAWRRRPARPPCAARPATVAGAGGARRRRTTPARHPRAGTRHAPPGRRARAPRGRPGPVRRARP